VRLLLIRHGQTPCNVLGQLDTAAPGAGLTALGRAQAQALPGALEAEDIAALYASPLVRTQLTAAPLAEARGLDVHVRPGLEEISAGEMEMRDDVEAVHAYAGCLAAWMHGDLGSAMPGGPDGSAFLARYDAAVAAVVDGSGAGDTVAVVTHGAAIRVYTALRTGMDPETATELRMMNTGMAVLEGDPAAGWQLVSWHAEPLGGLDLEDLSAHDVTGESAEEAAAEADPSS
jgi:broad specificity phosphatase PhoE